LLAVVLSSVLSVQVLAYLSNISSRKEPMIIFKDNPLECLGAFAIAFMAGAMSISTWIEKVRSEMSRVHHSN
jgi:hypothetical protein